MALTGVCALLYSILTCFIGACIIPLSYGFILYSDGIRYCFSHSINPLFCCFLFAFSQYQLARACVRLITTRRDAEYYRRIEWEYYQMIDCFGWCCRCWACALTVQNICHKFTFIWPNAADHPPPPSPPRLRIAYASAPPTVERVLRQRWRRRRCRRCCCCGLRPAAAWSAAASVHVVLSTLSVDQVAHRSDQCKLNVERKREKERGRDSARVRKGRQAIRWRMAGIVQRCSIFKLSYQFRDWITWKKKERA